MLTPHLIHTRDGRCVGVVRHPADQPPSASRHDVVWIARVPPPAIRSGTKPDLDRLLDEATRWIEGVSDRPETDLPPVAGYGPLDRRRGPYKTSPTRATARRKRAALLRAMRRQASMKVLRSLASQEQINDLLRRWPRLHAYYRSRQAPAAYRIPPRPPAPNHIKRVLERELEKARQQERSDYWQGRADVAAAVLALWERDVETQETTNGQKPVDETD